MKRDLDLIREILIKVEEYQPTHVSHLQRLSMSDFSGTEPDNFHHIRMLIEAGLLQSASMNSGGNFDIRGMTMAGHDFLDAVREKSVWEYTKKRLNAVGGWTLELVLSVAKDELKRRLLGDGV